MLDRKILGLLLAISISALSFGVAACGSDDDEDGSSGGSGQLEQVRLMMPFQDSIAWVGMLVARDRYYEDEGIEVETVPVDGSGLVVQQLISGKEDYGVITAADLLIANSKGSDLRAVAALDYDVFTVVAPSGSDVTSIEDLDGGSLGVTEASGGEASLVDALVDAYDLDVERVPVGPGGPASFNAIESGRVDAYAGGFNDLAALKTEGLEFTEILPEEFSNIPTDVLAVSDAKLAEQSVVDTAVKLSRGWIKGIVFAQENPEAALAISCEQVPEECKDMEAARDYMDATLQAAGIPEDTPPGAHDLDRWQVIADSLAGEDLEGDVDIAEAATDEYSDMVGDFDIEEVEKDARSAGSGGSSG